MKKIITLLILCVFSIQLAIAQHIQKKGKEDFQQEVTDLFVGLAEEASINQYKHVNQVVAFKNGLWVEPDRGKLWFISYLNGKKHGNFYCYELVTGKMKLKGKYKHDVLIDTLVIYDANGNMYSIYTEIKQAARTLRIDYEYPVGESFKLINEPYSFKYEAFVKKYTEEGRVYAEGIGLFDDQLTYINHDPERPGLGYRNSLSIFRIYKTGEWKEY